MCLFLNKMKKARNDFLIFLLLLIYLTDFAHLNICIYIILKNKISETICEEWAMSLYILSFEKNQNYCYIFFL